MASREAGCQVHRESPWNVSPDACSLTHATVFLGQAEGLQNPHFRLSFPDLWEGRSFSAPVIFTGYLDRRPYGLLGREPTFEHLGCRFDHTQGYGFFLTFRAWFCWWQKRRSSLVAASDSALAFRRPP